MNKDFKIEIGQEWQYRIVKDSFVINGFDHGWARDQNDRIHMLLNDDKTVMNYNDWIYLGIPTRCENCNLFCKQLC